ncbi:MAG TPA: hypothetical protein VKJ65_05150, partial [Phycisphaerae bacterium]|nr:hypothetical protein [Phycisphaerae bacterium]
PLPSSDTFHRQVMIRIKAEASASALETVVDSLRATFSNWRVALPIAAGLVALLAVGIGLRPHSAINVRPPSPVVARQVAVAPVDLAPTIANYQQVANQSLEKLDDLLVREGKQTGGPAQVCTASTMVLNF